MMNTSKKDDLIYTFRYCKVDVEFEENTFDEKAKEKIRYAIKQLSKHIVIDKTYVDFAGTKFEKTFIREEGWNNLNSLVMKTKYGKICSNATYQSLLLAYSTLIVSYLYSCLVDLGYDISSITLNMTPETTFMIEAEVDTIHAWKDYFGKWQIWLK